MMSPFDIKQSVMFEDRSCSGLVLPAPVSVGSLGVFVWFSVYGGLVCLLALLVDWFCFLSLPLELPSISEMEIWEIISEQGLEETSGDQPD